MTPTHKSLPRPADKWIPWYLALGFIVMLTPLAPMAYYSVHTMPGVVTDKAYEEGLAYNKAIASGTQQASLGWKGDITVDAPTTDTVVRYRLSDAQGKPIDNASVHVWLVRPVQGGIDRNGDMKAEGGGRYSAAIALPARGVWDVRVSATKKDANFQSEQRVVLK